MVRGNCSVDIFRKSLFLDLILHLSNVFHASVAAAAVPRYEAAGANVIDMNMTVYEGVALAATDNGAILSSETIKAPMMYALTVSLLFLPPASYLAHWKG
jgi:hypothetical protein